MNKRSRYKGIECLHCGHAVRDGLVAACTTLYLYTGWKEPLFSTKSIVNSLIKDGHEPSDGELRVRIVYHRKCLEKILGRSTAPLDPEVAKTMYEQYREELLERFEERKPGTVRYPGDK